MKSGISDLAVFGGKPAFAEKLHVGRPNVGDIGSFMKKAEQIFSTKWLTNYGPFVQEFESRIASLLGVKHCIAMCNGTVALEIAIRALGLTGEVIVPSFTFVATAHSLQWQGITPVFCDINPETHNIDPDAAERMITPKTTGIIGVHLWGRPCDIGGLTRIAKKHDLKLLFDSAHAFRASYQGEMIGRFGNAEVLSFHATKFLNTFEGGAIVTNDDELAQKIRLMKNFGFSGYDNVIYIGTNGKMSEASAAMGLVNLDRVDHFISINRRNYRLYKDSLHAIPGVHLISYDETEQNNYQYIIAAVDENVTGIGRDRIVETLHAENIMARRYFYPGAHRMEPYRSHFPHAGLLLPETEKLAARVLALPTGSSVGETEIGAICRLMGFVIQHGPEISERFKRPGPDRAMN